MYNTFHKKCPDHIANLFKLKGEVQINIRTRQANDYHIPNAKLKIHFDSPIIQAPKLYNTYTNQLDFRTSIGTQKRNIKKLLMSKYVRNIDM